MIIKIKILNFLIQIQANSYNKNIIYLKQLYNLEIQIVAKKIKNSIIKVVH